MKSTYYALLSKARSDVPSHLGRKSSCRNSIEIEWRSVVALFIDISSDDRLALSQFAGVLAVMDSKENRGDQRNFFREAVTYTAWSSFLRHNLLSQVETMRQDDSGVAGSLENLWDLFQSVYSHVAIIHISTTINTGRAEGWVSYRIRRAMEDCRLEAGKIREVWRESEHYTVDQLSPKRPIITNTLCDRNQMADIIIERISEALMDSDQFLKDWIYSQQKPDIDRDPALSEIPEASMSISGTGSITQEPTVASILASFFADQKIPSCCSGETSFHFPVFESGHINIHGDFDPNAFHPTSVAVLSEDGSRRPSFASTASFVSRGRRDSSFSVGSNSSCSTVISVYSQGAPQVAKPISEGK